MRSSLEQGPSYPWPNLTTDDDLPCEREQLF